jgi:hypothetical protein
MQSASPLIWVAWVVFGGAMGIWRACSANVNADAWQAGDGRAYSGSQFTLAFPYGFLLRSGG